MESGYALLTVGHGTFGADDLAGLLAGAGVEMLTDVRRFPASRRHPHLSAERLAQWLPEAGVGYRWDERLGGRRRVPPDLPPETDAWWQVQQFRAYAAHTRTPEFRTALAELLADASTRRVAIMCSETVWWRCHRRLIADVVRLTTDVLVDHLGHDGRLSPHPVAPGAQLTADGLVTYPPRS